MIIPFNELEAGVKFKCKEYNGIWIKIEYNTIVEWSEELERNPTAKRKLYAFAEEGADDDFIKTEVEIVFAPPFNPQIKEGDVLRCYHKTEDWHDITLGSLYVAAKDSYLADGREFVEIEQNDSWEPYTNWFAENFTVIREDIDIKDCSPISEEAAKSIWNITHNKDKG